MKEICVLALIIILQFGANAQNVQSAQTDAQNTFKDWVRGLDTKTITRRGTPSCLLTFGMESYPVFQTNAEKCGTFGAAAKAGLGRIAVFGHTDYPSYSSVLNSNVRRWLGETSADQSKVLSLNDLSESRFLLTNLRDIKLITWTSAQDFPSEKSLEKLETFVRNGGGLLVAYPAWVLTYYRGFASVNDFAMNKLLSRFGIALIDGYLEGDMPSVEALPSVSNFNAYYAVQAGLTQPSQQQTLLHAVEVLPIEVLDSVSPIYQYLNRGVTKVTFPIRKGDFRSRITVAYKARAYDRINDLKAIEGIEEIPGEVRSKQRRDVVLNIDREVADSWISTGYYLAAGEVLTVTALSPVQAWQVRIGCHSDSISKKDEWMRNPVITKQVKLVSNVTKITSPFGGLIYLVSSGSSCTKIVVRLTNVVEAPFFDLNSPNPVWNVNAPAPVAEIQGKFLTMSVPTRFVGNLKDPAALARFWDNIIEQFHKLRNTSPTRRERFVADIDISHGYMHAGYPIMTKLDVVTPKNNVLPIQLNVQELTTSGSWGHFHEIGHNLQRDWWTFDGTVEVTVNIFSLFAGHHCCKFSSLQNPWLVKAVNRTTQALNGYINKTKEEAYAWYRSEPSTFLVQYAMIQHYFGWEAYAKVFAAYEAASGPRPTANQDKIDVWVRELSKAVRKNLLPFFEIWRMPVSDKAAAEVAALGFSPWMPGARDYGISHINQSYLNEIREMEWVN